MYIFIYIFIHIWFLICCVTLVLLHFNVKIVASLENFGATTKLKLVVVQDTN